MPNVVSNNRSYKDLYIVRKMVPLCTTSTRTLPLVNVRTDIIPEIKRAPNIITRVKTSTNGDMI